MYDSTRPNKNSLDLSSSSGMANGRVIFGAELDASQSLPPELRVLLDSNRIGQITEPAIRGEQGLRPGLRHSCDLDVDRPHHVPRTGQLAGEETRLASIRFAERQELVPSRKIHDFRGLGPRALGSGHPLPQLIEDGRGDVDRFSPCVDLPRLRDGVRLVGPQVEDEARVEDHMRTSSFRRSLRASSMASRIAFTEGLLSIPAYSARGLRSVRRKTTSLKLSSGPFRAFRRS